MGMDFEARCVESARKEKDGVSARTIREGEFSETLIPNCLRKKRNAFLNDPETALKESGLDDPGDTKTAPKRITRVVVGKKIFHRKIFFLRRRKKKLEQFPEGGEITIQAGVGGKRRTTRLRGAWIIDGKGIGKQGKFIAILTKDDEE